MIKKFAVFDIDGTLIRWQLYHAISDTLVKLGYVAPETYMNVHDARMDWKRRSSPFKQYETELIKTYELVLKDLSTRQFMNAAQVVFDEYKDQVYTYTRGLIKNLKNQGYMLLAISGSQVEIVQKIADYYDFDDYVGTVYEQRSGKFTGAVTIGSADKAKTLENLIAKHNLSLKGSVAVGDGASDIPMMEMVEQPIALNPEKKLYEHAKAHGWRIVLERKNMVYELEAKNGKYELAKTN